MGEFNTQWSESWFRMTVAQTATDDVTGVEAGPAAADPEPFPKDEIFHILQNQRRRYVLRYLEGVEGQVQMRDIAEQVAAWEHDTTLDALTSNQRQRVYIALYQAHLPKLDEKGIIEYNQNRGIVERTARADQLTKYLDIPVSGSDDEEDAGTETPWEAYYLAASVLGSGLLVLTALNVSVFAGISNIVAGAAILTMFVLLTLGQVGERYLID